MDNIQSAQKWEWMEEARKGAELKMPEDWDRKDSIYIAAFYVHMLEYIDDNYALIKK